MMTTLVCRSTLLLLLWLGAGLASAQQRERAVESVLSALDSGESCWSGIVVENLGDEPVTVAVEAHKGSGALVPLTGHPEIAVRLKPGERGSYKLQTEEKESSAWVVVREMVRPPRRSPVVAVSGTTECLIGDQVRTAAREVAYPTRNPWFSGDVGEMQGGVVSLINASDRTARASACYSSGVLYSVPTEAHPNPALKPVCSSALDVQIPPFGTRLFPVEHDRNSHFSLKTRGDAIVLQMLRPVAVNVKMYAVDSTIQFGSEVPAEGGRQ
ncbi:MAG: hypothetical protein ACREH9_01460 [Pseudomonadota bacterium]